MKFDDILVHLGEFGKYQKIIYGLVSIPSVFCAMMAFIPVFMFGEQQHRCRLHGMTNDTFSVQNEQHLKLINESIPAGTDDKLSECVITRNMTEYACTDWVYDKSTFTSTVVSQFDLVCEDKTVQSHMSMAYFGGFFVASFTIGSLGDTLGRKPVFYGFCLLMFASNMALAWSPNMIVFGVLRFFNGFCGIGSYVSAFIIAMEIVGPGRRIEAGTYITFIWCFGEFILCGLAYFIRDWQHLQIAISVPMSVMLVFWWIIPESPRWLMARGKVDDAMKILQKAAKTNGVTLPEKVISMDEGEKQEVKSTFVSVKLMVKSPTILTRWLLVILNWSVVSMTYYGLTLNVSNLGGDVYVNFLISSVVELAGYVSCLLLMDRIGRKPMHCGTLLIGGISCLVTIFPTIYADESLQWTNTLLAMVGKLGISAAFAGVYIYSTELFPTVIRGFVMGTFNIGARVATMVCPYIVDLGKLVESSAGKALPLIIFGSLATITAILSLSLPETLNAKLPETIEDILESTRSPKKKNKTYREVARREDEEVVEHELTINLMNEKDPEGNEISNS